MIRRQQKNCGCLPTPANTPPPPSPSPTQSWLVSLYLDCPTGMGLHCPTAPAVAAFRAAVEAGDVYWHAMPHNAQV